MANLNKVMLMGNLTRDVELKYTPSGMAVARLGLAVNRRWRDATSNEMREEVAFIDIDAFGKKAEALHQYVTKGQSLYVEGRLKLNQWDDKTTGKKMSKLTVVLDTFEFLSSKASGAGGAGGGQAAPAGQTPMRSAPRPLPPRPPQGGNMQPSQVPQHDFASDEPPQEDLDIPHDSIPF